MDTQFVNNIASGNNIEAEKIFKDTMAQKVGDALEIKRKEMSNTFVKEPEVEETDEVWNHLRRLGWKRWA